MKAMGVKYYRMSFAWSRLFPNGKGKVQQALHVHEGGVTSRAARFSSVAAVCSAIGLQ
jgi:beta-glucosidase/6-phospho-beta-glucosidase/beta-galactosidase